MQLKVLCFNAWCLPEWLRGLMRTPQTSHSNKDRLRECLRLAADFDVIGFTEVWDAADRQWLRAEAKSNFAHSVDSPRTGLFARCGLSGPGLLLLSKHPIESFEVNMFLTNGKPVNPQHGDWYPGKGVLLAKLRIDAKLYTFVLTHTVACYGDKPNAPHEPTGPYDEYYYQRLAQICAVYGLIKQHATEGPLIVMGDLNMESKATAFRFLTGACSLRDSWVDCNAAEPGYTTIPPPIAHRVDYILYRGHLKPTKSELLMQGLSDHLAVATTFELDTPLQLSPTHNNVEQLEFEIAEGRKHIFHSTMRHAILMTILTWLIESPWIIGLIVFYEVMNFYFVVLPEWRALGGVKIK